MPAAVTINGITGLVLFSVKSRDEGTCLWGRGVEWDQAASALGVWQVGQSVGTNQTEKSLGRGLIFTNLLRVKLSFILNEHGKVRA